MELQWQCTEVDNFIKGKVENMKQNTFLKSVCNLAIPVAIQSMLQSSFSIVDQIMIGQLGSVSVAGVGLAGKFSSIYTVLISVIGAVAGVMIAQYLGQKNKQEIHRSFWINMWIGVVFAAVFTVLCGLFPVKIMGMYTRDADTMVAAGEYLKILSGTFLPVAGATLLATLFRCMEKTQLPLIASIVAAILNTGLNYILIFGKFGFNAMGARGAAIATLISQIGNFIIMFVLLFANKQCLEQIVKKEKIVGSFHWKQYMAMLLPMLVCEFFWSLGENVYAIIYGHLGTKECAAMTLINPIQGLMIGALCGLSQAAGVIIGKLLGNKEYDEAYKASWKLIKYGFIGSVCLSVIIVLTSGLYVEIYQVEDTVKIITRQILFAYACVAPFKVLNMITGGGIIRSGGKTKYLMVIDMIGTWGFGVPLGLLSAFVFHLTIPWVYFILSLEECVRFGISVVVLKRKKWMQSL